jgi:deoxyribodipyrimidine photo-lyase
MTPLPDTTDHHLGFKPGKDFARRRLQEFVERAGEAYARTRNFDYGPGKRHNVSLLSPYIRNGLLSEEEVARAVLERHSFSAAEKFIQEVFWRTYWKGYLQNRPSIWTNYLTEHSSIARHFENSEPLLKAQNGETAIACFDSWALELKETGYLHNHARMWFASIWIFTLKLPWQLGADFFLRHLMDGDPASNTLGWRWVAGLHTRGKTYLASASNIDRYTCQRFPEHMGLAEFAMAIAEEAPTPEPDFLPLPDAPLQLGEGDGLLILDEDLRYLASELQPGLPVLGLYPQSAYTDLNLSKGVQEFRLESLRSALEDASSRGCITAIETDPGAAKVLSWARAKNLKRIVISEPKVGLWDSLWKGIAEELQASGVTLNIFRPWWENELFPFCTAGFFKMKSKLPNVLRRIQAET